MRPIHFALLLSIASGCSSTTAPPSTNPSHGAGKADDGASCAPGLTNCGGSCVDIQIDSDNCGACGNACWTNWGCMNAGQVIGTSNQLTKAPACVFGAPRLTLADLTECGGLPVDLHRDAQHCGSCDYACPTPAPTCKDAHTLRVATGICSWGVCGLPAYSEIDCPLGCANGACNTPPTCGSDGGTGSCCNNILVDTQSDAQNCGGCGIACPFSGPVCSGKDVIEHWNQCTGGVCLTTVVEHCRDACANGACCALYGSDCESDQHCCSGLTCQGGRCEAPGCADESRACNANADCCTNFCSAGYCQYPPPACHANGDSCQNSGDCCSSWCANFTATSSFGSCSPSPPPTCGGIDAVCTLDSDCCQGATCWGAANSVRHCRPLECLQSGENCGGDTSCCSGACSTGGGVIGERTCQ